MVQTNGPPLMLREPQHDTRHFALRIEVGTGHVANAWRSMNGKPAPLLSAGNAQIENRHKLTQLTVGP
jgi:hypothetical protein